MKNRRESSCSSSDSSFDNSSSSSEGENNISNGPFQTFKANKIIVYQHSSQSKKSKKKSKGYQKKSKVNKKAKKDSTILRNGNMAPDSFYDTPSRRELEDSGIYTLTPEITIPPTLHRKKFQPLSTHNREFKARKTLKYEPMEVMIISDEDDDVKPIIYADEIQETATLTFDLSATAAQKKKPPPPQLIKPEIDESAVILISSMSDLGSQPIAEDEDTIPEVEPQIVMEDQSINRHHPVTAKTKPSKPIRKMPNELLPPHIPRERVQPKRNVRGTRHPDELGDDVSWSDDPGDRFKVHLDSFVSEYGLTDAICPEPGTYSRLKFEGSNLRTFPQLVFREINFAKMAKALIRFSKIHGGCKVGSTIIRMVRSKRDGSLGYYLNMQHKHLELGDFLAFFAHDTSKMRHGELVPFVLAYLFGISVASSGDRGTEHGKVSPNETNLVGTYLIPCHPSDPESIFLRLLRIDHRQVDKLLEAFGVLKVCIEAGLDVKLCPPCNATYLGDHVHESSHVNEHPDNLIDPKDYGSMGIKFHEKVESVLVVHGCKTLLEYVEKIKIDFMEGVACGKRLQGSVEFRSEKEVYNAHSHPHWFMANNNNKIFFSESILKLEIKDQSQNGIYRCSSQNCNFLSRRKTDAFQHALKCTHMQISTAELYATIAQN